MAREMLALVVALAVAACGGPTQTPAPSPAGQPTGQPTISPFPSSSEGAATSAPSQPGVTEAPTQGVVVTPEPSEDEPLPAPTLTDAGDVAAALFDSESVPQGVVSLLDLMGVEITDAAGTVLRPGGDRGAGELTITENEVRGLIEMTQDDLPLQDESGGPFPLANMYTALQPSLPADYSIDEFAADFDEAYSEGPDALASQVLRGQNLTADSGVLRIQMWLMLIDAFVGGPEGAGLPSFGYGPGGIAQLPPGQTLGQARQVVTGLTPPANWNPADWAEAIYRLPTLASTIFIFSSGPRPIHEGHGGPGGAEEFTTSIGAASSIVSQLTGREIISAANRPGVTVRWTSPNSPTWSSHGAFDQALPASVTVDMGNAGGHIYYTPKKEDANGAGTQLSESATLYTTVDQLDLVTHAYDLGPSLSLAAAGLISGTVKSSGLKNYKLEWHELGDGYWVDITWTDIYNGIPDTITIRGKATTKVTDLPGINFTGIGIATGDRSGWASCNPGIDFLPTGPSAAEIDIGVQGQEIVFSAFPNIGTGLAGIYTGPFIVPAKGGEVEQPRVQVPSGELCQHYLQWKGVAVKIGHP